MNLGLEGKVLLLFGASKGIGRATADVLASEGALLAVTARSLAAFDAVAFPTGEGNLLKLAADLMEPGAADAAVAQTLARFGRIDGMIVSAGAAQGGVFWDLNDAVWEAAFALKFMGMVRALRAVTPTMRDQGSGRMVVIVGNAGKQPHKRLLPGSAANAACLAVIRGLAEELAPHGVQVNAINPGPTRTARWRTLIDTLAATSGRDAADIETEQLARIPLGRPSEPMEIARLAAILVSEAAGTVTGTSLTSDGGMTAAIA